MTTATQTVLIQYGYSLGSSASSLRNRMRRTDLKWDTLPATRLKSSNVIGWGMCFDPKYKHARQGMPIPDQVPEFQRLNRTFALLP